MDLSGPPLLVRSIHACRQGHFIMPERRAWELINEAHTWYVLGDDFHLMRVSQRSGRGTCCSRQPFYSSSSSGPTRTYIYIYMTAGRMILHHICPLLSALYRMHNYWIPSPQNLCLSCIYLDILIHHTPVLDKGAYTPGTHTHTHAHRPTDRHTPLLVIIHLCRALSSPSAPLDATLQRSTRGLVWTARMTYTSPSCARSSLDKCWTKPRHRHGACAAARLTFWLPRLLFFFIIAPR